MEGKGLTKDIVVNYLLQKIETGELQSGAKIPTERKLVEELGISRVPIREAISKLATLGILEAHQGGGTYVCYYKPSFVGNIIRTYGILNQPLESEVFEARSFFEADAAALAARNCTKDDLRHLNEALHQHEYHLDDYYEEKISAIDMMRYDSAVHLGIAASSHNQFMVQVVEILREVTEKEAYFDKDRVTDNNHFKKSAIAHRKIYDALCRKDEQGAYLCMKEHIEEISRVVDRKREE